MPTYNPVQERPSDEVELEIPQERIPEANLWIAVIDQALEDLMSLNRREAAIRWLASDVRSPGSFRWACDHLDLNPHAVRAALRRHRR